MTDDHADAIDGNQIGVNLNPDIPAPLAHTPHVEGVFTRDRRGIQWFRIEERGFSREAWIQSTEVEEPRR